MNLAVTAGFLLCMLIIGLLKSRKGSGLLNYYVSGRSESTLRITGSLVATIIGGSATIGLSGLGFIVGLPAVWWLLNASFCLVILGIFWAGKVRRYEVFTLPAILEKQYGSQAVKVTASVIIVVAWTGVIAAQMVAAGKILNILWPGNYRLLLISCSLIFIIYTFTGGQYSVISADLFQSIIIISGILLVFILAVTGYGKVSALSLPPEHLYFPVNSTFGYRMILTYFLFVGSSYIVGPDIYSRIFSTKDEIVARNSIFFTAIIIGVLAFVIVMCGIYARSIAPTIDPESAFPELILRTLPDGLKGFAFSALLAAFLSTAATCLLTSGIIITSDILNPLIFHNRLSDDIRLKLTRYIILIYGFFVALIALYSSGIIKLLLFALTIYTSGLVIPVILGFYRDNICVNSSGVMAGIFSGATSSLLLKLLSADRYLVYIFPVIIMIIMISSRLPYRINTRTDNK